MRDQPCCHLDSDLKVRGIVLCKGVTRGRFVPTDVCFFFSNAFEHIRNWNATAGCFYAFWKAMVFKKDHFPIFSLNHLLYLPYIFRGTARYTERWHLPQNQQSWLGKIVGEAHVDLARKLGPTRHGGEIAVMEPSLLKHDMFKSEYGSNVDESVIRESNLCFLKRCNPSHQKVNEWVESSICLAHGSWAFLQVQSPLVAVDHQKWGTQMWCFRTRIAHQR